MIEVDFSRDSEGDDDGAESFFSLADDAQSEAAGTEQDGEGPNMESWALTTMDRITEEDQELSKRAQEVLVKHDKENQRDADWFQCEECGDFNPHGTVICLKIGCGAAQKQNLQSM